MIFIFEISGPFKLLPGVFRSKIGGKRFIRFWWLYFAVGVYWGDLYHYNKSLKYTEWEDG